MLSVIVIVGRQRARAERGLQSILAQQTAEPLELIVVDLAPEAGALQAVRDARVRTLPRPGLRRLAVAAATGVRASRGEYVAFLEDHCHAQPGWAAAVVEAFQRPVDVVNYAFIDSEPSTYLSRAFLMAEYGRWMHPAKEGEISIPACNNIAYRREVLERYDRVQPLEEWFRAEFTLHRRIRRDGGVIWQSAKAIAAHEDWISVRKGLTANGVMKRYHAAALASGQRPWSRARRLLYAGGMALVPPLELWRAARSVAPRPALWRAFAAGLPICVLVYSYASVFEAIGYVAGAGASPEDFVVVELEMSRK